MMAVAFQVAAIIVPFASPRIPGQQEVQKFGAREAGRVSNCSYYWKAFPISPITLLHCVHINKH